MDSACRENVEPHRGCNHDLAEASGEAGTTARKSERGIQARGMGHRGERGGLYAAEPDVEENAREMLAGNPGHEIHVIRMGPKMPGRGMWHRPLW